MGLGDMFKKTFGKKECAFCGGECGMMNRTKIKGDEYICGKCDDMCSFYVRKACIRPKRLPYSGRTAILVAICRVIFWSSAGLLMHLMYSQIQVLRQSGMPNATSATEISGRIFIRRTMRRYFFSLAFQE